MAGLPTTAIRGLLNAAAVRERAHEMLELALDGGVEGWTVDLDRLDDAAELTAAVTREALSRPRHPLPRPLAPFRRRRAGAARRATRPSARARPSTSSSSRCCSTPAPGPAGASPIRSTGGTFTRSEGLAVASQRMFEAGALDDLRRRSTPATLAPRLPGQRRQSARRPRRPRRPAPPPRRAGAGAAGPVRHRRRAAPGGLYDVLAARAEGGRLPAAGDPRAAARGARADLGGPARSSTAFRSAIAGAIRRSAATTPATGWCRCTSSRNGWLIR